MEWRVVEEVGMKPHEAAKAETVEGGWVWKVEVEVLRPCRWSPVLSAE